MLPVNGDGRGGAVSSFQHGLPHEHLHKRDVLMLLRGAQGALHDSVAVCETRSASSNGGREQAPQASLPAVAHHGIPHLDEVEALCTACPASRHEEREREHEELNVRALGASRGVRGGSSAVVRAKLSSGESTNFSSSLCMAYCSTLRSTVTGDSTPPRRYTVPFRCAASFEGH